MFAMRRRSPVPMGRPKLEMRKQPLWANAEISSTSTNLQFFREAQGTGGTALIDTNMPKAGALPHPRVFDIHAIATQASLGLVTRSSAGPPATEENPHNVALFNNALKLLLNGAFFRLIVGTKPYIEAPLFLIPGNCKVSGAIIGATPETTTFGATGRRDIFSSGVGMSWSTQKRRIRLHPDQVFYAEIILPTTGAGIAASNGRVVYVFLDGLEYREVQ